MPVSLFFDAWLGLAFAWCARERIRADGIWSQPSVTIVGMFLGMIRIPTTIYLHLAHPDWSWLYLFDSNRMPALAIVPIVAASSGALVGGYYGGARMVRSLKDKVVLSTVGGLGLFVLLLVFLVRHRLSRYGSYPQFKAGLALPIGDVKLGYVLVAVVIGVLASAAFVGWELKRDGRRAASR